MEGHAPLVELGGAKGGKGKVFQDFLTELESNLLELEGLV